jgi:hypothetical protein
LPTTHMHMDKYEQLKKLSDLRDKDILTEKEFNDQKQLILGEESPQPEKQTRASCWRPTFALFGGILNLLVSFGDNPIQDILCLSNYSVVFLGSACIGLCIACLMEKKGQINISIAAIILNAVSMIHLLLI